MVTASLAFAVSKVALIEQQIAALDQQRDQQSQASEAARVNAQWRGIRICGRCCQQESLGHADVCGDAKHPPCPGHADRGKSCILPTDELKARKHADFREDLKIRNRKDKLQQRLAREKDNEVKRAEKKVRILYCHALTRLQEKKKRHRPNIGLMPGLAATLAGGGYGFSHFALHLFQCARERVWLSWALLCNDFRIAFCG